MVNFNDVCNNVFPKKTLVKNGYTITSVLPGGQFQDRLNGYGGVDTSGVAARTQSVPNNISPSGFSTVLSQRLGGGTMTVFTIASTGVNPG